MTKKIMMVAVLLGALTLGACVDNKESASVEAVRNAKAAQLNSIAAMNNAEAEAKKIISEAEAALTNAEAEAQKIENERSKAVLEGDLEKIKIQAEAAIARAKADLEAAKADLIRALDNVSIATKERITVLLGKADLVLNDVNSLRLDLVQAKNNLIGLKYDLISAEAMREQVIIQEKLNKAKAEALIAEYEKYSQEDKANAEQAVADAKAKEQGLLNTMNAKSGASSAANIAFNEANANMYGTLYYTTLNTKPSTYFTTEDVAKFEVVSYIHDNGVAGNVTKTVVTKRIAKLDMFQKDVNEASRNLAIARATQSEAQKALNDVKSSQPYIDQVAAVSAAQTAFNAATTAADKASAKATLDSAEIALKSMTSTEESALEAATTVVTANETILAVANKDLANVSGDNLTTYNNAVTAVLSLRDSKADAEIASSKASINYSTQSTLVNGLNNVALGLADYADLILTEKQNVANADKAIADAANVITKEQLIAKEESRIAKLEVDLKANEASYSAYMAQIQGLISAE